MGIWSNEISFHLLNLIKRLNLFCHILPLLLPLRDQLLGRNRQFYFALLYDFFQLDIFPQDMLTCTNLTQRYKGKPNSGEVLKLRNLTNGPFTLESSWRAYLLVLYWVVYLRQVAGKESNLPRQVTRGAPRLCRTPSHLQASQSLMASLMSLWALGTRPAAGTWTCELSPL